MQPVYTIRRKFALLSLMGVMVLALLACQTVTRVFSGEPPFPQVADDLPLPTWTSIPNQSEGITDIPENPGSPVPLPDLIITGIRIRLETGDACDYTSTSLGVEVYVSNQGQVASGPFVVETNGTSKEYLDGLEPGEFGSLWFLGYAYGPQVVVVDLFDQVSESDENNNRQESSAPIPTLPLPCTPQVTVTTTPVPQTEVPGDMARQLAVFQELWDIVNEEYLYTDFNGLDWQAVYGEYRSKIQAGLSDEQFYLAMDEMIYSLGDEHSVFLSPEQAAQEDQDMAGNLDYVGVGILVSSVPERSRAVILLVFPGSPAEQAGLKSRDSILAVDGQPILDEEGQKQDLIRGPEGTSVRLLIETPGQAPREVEITRRRISGSLPVLYQTFLSPEGKRIAYIFITTFLDTTTANQVAEALGEMTAEGPLDGVIVDNRYNEGGVDSMLSQTLGFFTRGTVGYFVNRWQEQPLRVIGVDINGSQQVPLVVLVGEETISFGEVFAGVLQGLDRAYLIGQTTLGNVEALYGYNFEDGSRAWIAHDTFRPAHNLDANWEEEGIVPDLEVISPWDLYSFETDPAIMAALTYFDR